MRLGDHLFDARFCGALVPVLNAGEEQVRHGVIRLGGERLLQPAVGNAGRNLDTLAAT